MFVRQPGTAENCWQVLVTPLTLLVLLIAGVVVFSRRGDAIAAWLNGYEVSNLLADADRAGLILETGVNKRWRHGRYNRSAETTGEAVAWEKAKKDVRCVV